ncbi:lycopene cyclase domain-containing protein [Curtobacterium sp. MCBA15_004]|uniref:lycopene cyclase domain-containing protein n=1 Tax=unclassified Curtobacterium TaxID=257496 RepID=UPI0008DCA99F|nr:lycopene cyclase domain-containing protein [Curtobacterium sp. MCBA15_004]WIA97309.1 lycopene cyclase domain-containing protein [Curtobacterium sp. MCBA15_004]
MPGVYLAGLVVSIVGVAVLDARHRLFFWRAPWRAAAVMAVGLAFFLVWDAAGVALGIFFIGQQDLLTGVLLAPEVPLEELFFLVLLCWTTMDLVGAVRPVLERRAARKRAAVDAPAPVAPGASTRGRS